MANAQAVLVQELRESHQREMDRLKMSVDEAAKAARGLETSEMYRMREDIQSRYCLQ